MICQSQRGAEEAQRAFNTTEKIRKAKITHDSFITFNAAETACDKRNTI
jgi:hypothetical protein